MSNIQGNLTAVGYIREIKPENFDIVDFLKYFSIGEAAAAMSFFKDTINKILSFSKEGKTKKKNKKLVEFAKTMKRNKYAIVNSAEAKIYYIQCAQDQASLNREMSFAESAVAVTDAIEKGKKRPIKIKLLCEQKENLDERGESSKKRKFVERDGVTIEGLSESLGSKIGNDARCTTNIKSKKKTYFKTCGMNGIIDLSDIMPGSQLNTFSKSEQDSITNKLTSDKYIVNNTLANENMCTIITKAFKSGESVYERLQELDEMKCNQETYGSKMICHLILYNIVYPLMTEKFSEADFILNIWAPIIKYTFSNTSLWSHWGDTVPVHLKENSPIYIKLDFRLLSRSSEKPDWATGEVGVKVVDWKYFTDKTKLILVTKGQVNELVEKYNVNQNDISKIKIPFIHILGLTAVVCYMELHQNGLYKIIQVASFKYPTTKLCLQPEKINDLLSGLSALKGMSLDLFDFVCDLKKLEKSKGKNKMDRSNTNSDNIESVGSWTRELWFPPDFASDD